FNTRLTRRERWRWLHFHWLRRMPPFRCEQGKATHPGYRIRLHPVSSGSSCQPQDHRRSKARGPTTRMRPRRIDARRLGATFSVTASGNAIGKLGHILQPAVVAVKWSRLVPTTIDRHRFLVDKIELHEWPGDDSGRHLFRTLGEPGVTVDRHVFKS